MSHTKRIYNRRLTYRGIWQPYHPYKQLTMKCHCRTCQSRRAYLDHKRRRQAGKAEVRQRAEMDRYWADLEGFEYFDPYDPLAELVDIYLDFTNDYYNYLAFIRG